MEVTPRSLSRRSLLAGVMTAAAGASGCGLLTHAKTVAPPVTIGTLTGTSPFYIAHRGGGGDWPEMTGYAYEQCASLKDLHALEISVCLSADGVLVCSHDPSTKRVTGVDYTIADQPWARLSSLVVSASATRDPSQPGQRLTRFDDVAAAHIDRFVLFVEPKVPQAASPLMMKMASFQQPERVVWKQYINSKLFATAKTHGFATWGYVLNEPSHLGDNLMRLAASPSIDMLGAPASENDDFVRNVSDAATRNGKQTIMWPIKSSADRDRAVSLGCAGMMTSRVSELVGG